MKKLIPYLLLVITISCKNKPNIDYKVTDAEATTFAKMIEAAIRDHKKEVLNDAIYAPAMAEKFGKIKASQKELKALVKGMDIGKRITAETANDGTYEFVKLMDKDAKKYVLFRLYGSNGINYHQLELCKAENAVKISDIYIFLSGEFLTETVQDLFTTVTGDGNLTKKTEDDVLEATTQIKKLKKYIEEEKFTEAKVLYDALPAKLKTNSSILLYGIFIAQCQDSSSYETALSAYKKVKPNALNLDLLMIDGCFLKKDYKGVLAAVDRLDAYINKDPFLDYYRYLVYNMLADNTKSLEHIEKAAKAFPNYEIIQLELIAIYNELHKEKQLATVVADYKNNPSFNQQKLQLVLDN
jgi:tetratricopeptide (TPR) repeat protein